MAEQIPPTEVEIVVIGMGVAGEAVAGDLAEAGLSVVGIESGLVGGECPYYGCIPTKMMIRASNLIGEIRRAPGILGKAQVEPDWSLVADRIRAEATDTWDDTVAVNRFVGKGGEFVRGRARILEPGLVEAAGRRFRATRGVVLTAGTVPAIPPIPGLAETPYWTNRDAVAVTTPPESLAVIGAGAIGVEFAQVFARFGTTVTVIEAAGQLLPQEEPHAGETVREALREDGVRVITGISVTDVSHSAAGFTVALADQTVVRTDRLLVATGRRVELAGLGLDAYGVSETGALPVDDHLRVAPSLWAVGDVTGVGAFTHVATYQAAIAVADILGTDPKPARYHAIPRVTFTDPEVGAVGLTESQARARGIDVAVGRTLTAHTARGWLHKAGNEGALTLVADVARGTLVGATAVGPHGGEVLGMLTLAVSEQIPIERLRRMIYAYPTFHRGVEDALRDLQANLKRADSAR